jgi:S-adenosylmethionine decarboxylase
VQPDTDQRSVPPRRVLNWNGGTTLRPDDASDVTEEVRHTSIGYDFLAGENHGQMWRFDVFGCRRNDMADLGKMKSLFDELIAGFELHPMTDTQWRQFPGGGVTGLCLLAESHLAVHTFPEHGVMWVDLLCCRARAEWGVEDLLRRQLGEVSVYWSCEPRPFRPLTPRTEGSGDGPSDG